jgi:hypothetical protein
MKEVGIVKQKDICVRRKLRIRCNVLIHPLANVFPSITQFDCSRIFSFFYDSKLSSRSRLVSYIASDGSDKALAEQCVRCMKTIETEADVTIQLAEKENVNSLPSGM